MIEKTGVAIHSIALRLFTVTTTTDRRQNVIFCEGPRVTKGGFIQDVEVSEAHILREPVEAAFSLHVASVEEFWKGTLE